MKLNKGEENYDNINTGTSRYTKQTLDSANVAGFYSTLETYGDPYGRLGKDVTNNDSWQGQMANGFAASAAKEQNIDLSYGSDGWKALNKNLADRYLLAIQDKNGALPDYQAIQTIHNLAYQAINIPTNAWLPNLLLNQSPNPTVLWQDWMSNDGTLDVMQDITNVAGLVLGPSLEYVSHVENGVVIGNPYELYSQQDHLDAAKFTKNLVDSWGGVDSNGISTLLSDLNPAQRITQSMMQIRSQLSDSLSGIVNYAETLIGGIIPDAFTWGDPHLVTFDKSSYDFQKPGEYVLAKSTADDFEIQVRQELLLGSESISLNTAVATHLNGTKVGLYNYPRYEMHGTEGNDRLSAKSATTLMLGGKDNGVATLTTGADVSFISSQTSYRNTFGYYVADDSGNPSTGQIIWANSRAGQAGDIFSYGFNITQDRLGFFLISNGYNHNGGLANGDAVTFSKVGSAWRPFKGSVGLSSEFNGLNPPAYAFYGDVAFNTDNVQHRQFNGNVQYWEDLYGGGDYSYDDVVFGTSLSEGVSINRGDTLIGGAGEMTFGYQMGRDGVDRIEGFNPAKHNITFYQGDLSEIELRGVTGGTFIRTSPVSGTSGGIFVEDVTTEQLTPRIGFDDANCVQETNLYIGNQAMSMASGELQALGGGLLYRDGKSYTVITEYGDGFAASVYDDHIDVRPFLSNNRSKGSMEGLLGSNDDNPDNDLALNDGTVLSSPVLASTLYGDYANAWHVMAHDSLFHYRCDENSATFDNPSFSGQYRTYLDFPQEEITSARQAALGAGYNESNALFKDVMLEILAGGVDIADIGVSERDYSNVQTKEVLLSMPPTSLPTSMPSERPTGMPSSLPSSIPSGNPSALPTSEPSTLPSGEPSNSPSSLPSSLPSEEPTGVPTSLPTSMPSERPTGMPSSLPSSIPSGNPSALPTSEPSTLPSGKPSNSPITSSYAPSNALWHMPSAVPSLSGGHSPDKGIIPFIDKHKLELGVGVGTLLLVAVTFCNRKNIIRGIRSLFGWQQAATSEPVSNTQENSIAINIEEGKGGILLGSNDDKGVELRSTLPTAEKKAASSKVRAGAVKEGAVVTREAESIAI